MTNFTARRVPYSLSKISSSSSSSSVFLLSRRKDLKFSFLKKHLTYSTAFFVFGNKSKGKNLDKENGRDTFNTYLRKYIDTVRIRKPI